jgi:hypothetical protein
MSYIKRWLEDGCPADAEYKAPEKDEYQEPIDMLVWYLLASTFLGLVIAVSLIAFVIYLA